MEKENKVGKRLTHGWPLKWRESMRAVVGHSVCIVQTHSFCLLSDLDSTNQTVIINENTSSDGSTVAAQIRLQAQQLGAAQPIITSTSSAPDVLCGESLMPPYAGSHHDNYSIIGNAPRGSAESGYVWLEEHGSTMPPMQQNWAVMPNRQNAAPRPWVPAYRPAPDYDAVMQQRLLSHCYPLYYVHSYPNQDCMSFSQPDIYQHSSMVGQWNPAGTRVPVTYGGNPVDRASSLVIHPQPEVAGVARHASAASSIMPRTNQYLYYRVPPPYPRQSSSTPDLVSPTKFGTVLTHGGLGIHQRHLLHSGAQCQFDESLENLAAEVQQVHVYSQSGRDNSVLELGQSGLPVHHGNIVDVSRHSAAGHYGPSTSADGVGFDHRNNEANQLSILHFNEYVLFFTT